MRIKKRNTCLELFDIAPVTDFDGELSLFMSYMVSGGYKLQNPCMSRGTRPTTVQVSHAMEYISRRLKSIEGVDYTGVHQEDAALIKWIEETLLVDAEPYSPETRHDKPIGGIACPSYLGLRMSNVGAIRERYWGAFAYLALATELEYAQTTGIVTDLAGARLNAFYADGLTIDSTQDAEKRRTYWHVSPKEQTGCGGLLQVVIDSILTGEERPPDPNDFSLPLPGTQAGALKVDRNHFVGCATRRNRVGFQAFLCPGSIVLMKRALLAVLDEKQVAREKTADLLKTVLTFHTWLYYRRSFFVLNTVSQTGDLPACCKICWQSFQEDLVPSSLAIPPLHQRGARWQKGDYRAKGTDDNAGLVEQTCKCPRMFFNLGPKENRHATEVAMGSLQGLYEEQDNAVLNRIWIGHLIEVMASGTTKPRDLWVDRILAKDDTPDAEDLKLLLIRWVKDEVLPEDQETTDARRQQFKTLVDDDGTTPRTLLKAVREYIAETMTSRDFSRYHEVLNSMMGGGELPTNENPRGMLARTANSKSRFYPTLLRESLELLVLLFAARKSDRAQSFPEFVRFLSDRYGVNCNEVPSAMGGTTPVDMRACEESRNALRERLRAAGYLWEFSDNEEWNQVRWTRILHYER